MDHQSSCTSTNPGTSKCASDSHEDDGPTSADGVQEEAVASASTSGGSGSVAVQQHEGQFLLTFRQCQQLFFATCRVKVQRCDEVPATNVSTENNASDAPPAEGPTNSRPAVKVEDSNDCSSDEDDIKVLPSPRATPAGRSEAPIVPTRTAASHAPSNSKTVGRKIVKEEIETGSDCSSEDEDIKVLRAPRAATSSKNAAAPPVAPSKQNEAIATKKVDKRSVCKLVEYSETGSSSSSEDDNVQEVAASPSAVTSKKKDGKRVGQRSKSPAQCTICKKTFSSKYYLKDHLSKHSGQMRYKCGSCGRSFWSRNTFSAHEKVRNKRNGVCPRQNKITGGWWPKGAWTCKICRKRIKYPSSYQPHMRSHRGERPFKCEECGKAFVTKGSLCEHRRIHSGVWQYSCVFCDRGFHSKSNYWNHLRGHTEEKPYFCVVDGCAASFRRLKSLQSHRRLIHLKKY